MAAFAKTRYFIPVLCIILAAGFGLQCKKDKPTEPDNPPSAGAIYPLAVGNQWTYTVSLSTDGGPYVEQGPYSLEVMQFALRGGRIWYSFNNRSVDSFPEDFCANLTDGFNFNADTPGLYFKYPAKTGDSWTVPNVRTGKVVAINTAVTVPKGSYSCYEYSIHIIGGLSDSARYYCHPDVGMVKFFLWYSNLTYKYELNTFVKAAG